MNTSQGMKAHALKAVALQLGFQHINLSLTTPALPTIPASSLTNTEVFKLYGHLPADRLEALLDTDRIYTELGDIGIEGCLEEAKGHFPDEDFAADVLSDLREMSKRVRGDNQMTLHGIINDLEAKQKEVYDTALAGVKILETIIKGMNAL